MCQYISHTPTIELLEFELHARAQQTVSASSVGAVRVFMGKGLLVVE
jgi:hypothetical protein